MNGAENSEEEKVETRASFVLCAITRIIWHNLHKFCHQHSHRAKGPCGQAFVFNLNFFGHPSIRDADPQIRSLVLFIQPELRVPTQRRRTHQAVYALQACLTRVFGENALRGDGLWPQAFDRARGSRPVRQRSAYRFRAFRPHSQGPADDSDLDRLAGAAHADQWTAAVHPAGSRKTSPAQDHVWREDS